MPLSIDPSKSTFRQPISLYTHSCLWVRKECWVTKFVFVNKWSYLYGGLCVWGWGDDEKTYIPQLQVNVVT